MKTAIIFAALMLAGCTTWPSHQITIRVHSNNTFAVDGEQYTTSEMIAWLREQVIKHGQSKLTVYFDINGTNMVRTLANAVRITSMAGIWQPYLIVDHNSEPERIMDAQELLPSQSEITVVVSPIGMVGDIGSISELKAAISRQPTNNLPYRVWIECDSFSTPVYALRDIIVACNEFEWTEPCVINLRREESEHAPPEHPSGL